MNTPPLVEAPTVAFVTSRRHVDDPTVRGAMQTLTDHGCRVELVSPDGDRAFEVPRYRPEWSLAVSRGRDDAGLAMLATAAALGVPTINHPRSIDLVRNKIAMMATLADHGIPLPRTWYAHDPAVFTSFPADRFPLVVKPFDGDNARGIALLERPGDATPLSSLPTSGLYLAQEYLPTDGHDVKLYGIGAQVWAVRKPAPVRFTGHGPALSVSGGVAEPVPLTPALRDLALTCGRACRLDLWGVDVAITPRGPFVIEVNDFPSYSAVPQAGERVASLVLTCLELDAVTAGMSDAHLSGIVREPR